MSNLFDKLDAKRPTPEIKQPAQPSHAQKLLTWLPRWPRDTITVRQIRVYSSLKGRTDAINAAEVLVANGWLSPTKPHRPDTYAWKIIRKNVLNPTVEM